MIALAGPLWANGGEEGLDSGSELEAAKVLVDERRLDEAIEILVEIARKDPEQMERIQKVIQDIQIYKDESNTLLALASEALDEGDTEKALEYINMWKERFPYPNRNDRNNLIILTASVSRQEDQKSQNKIFEEAAVLLAAEDYRTAVQKYRSGINSRVYLDLTTYDVFLDSSNPNKPIDIYEEEDPERQDLIWEAYGTYGPSGEIAITELSTAMDLWDAEAAQLPSITDVTLSGIQTARPEDWPAETGTIDDALFTLLSDQEAIQEKSEDLAVIRQEMETILEFFEEFHYERIDHFIQGRPGRENTEGIRYAQEKLWEQTFLEVAGQMFDILESSVDTGHNAFLVDDFVTTGIAMAAAESSAISLGDYLIGAGAVLESHRAREIDRFESVVDELNAYSTYAENAAPLWVRLGEIMDSAPGTGDLDFETLNLAEIDRLAELIQDSVVEVEDLIEEWNRTASGLSTLPAAGLLRPESVDNLLRQDLASAITNLRELRVTLYLNAIIPIYQVKEREAQSAMDVDIDGLTKQVNGQIIDDILPVKRPFAALTSIIQPKLNELNAAIDSVGDFLDILDEILNLDPPIKNPDELEPYFPQAENLILDMEKVSQELLALEREARLLVSAARTAETSANNTLNTAGRDLAAAQTAVQRGQQTNDIDEFYNAVDLYNAVESSLKQVDDLYETVRENDIDIAESSGISEESIRLQNQVITDKSRVAVTVKENAVQEGRRAFDDTRYGEGISVVAQALEFYVSANGIEDTELAGWLKRLTNAQQALLKTVIEPNDPLYSEMNQYLNLANNQYAEGFWIVENDKGNGDAPKLFKAAGHLLDQVLNTFPGNKAALLLEQKILKETDFPQWSEDARILFSETRRTVDRAEGLWNNPARVNEFEAFKALLLGNDDTPGLYPRILVLQEIDPGYRGITDLIYDAKIVLEIIPRPISEADRNRSIARYQQALAIWNQFGLTRADEARVLCIQAISIWLDNLPASDLLRVINNQSNPAPLPEELKKRLVQGNDFLDKGNVTTSRIIYNTIVTDFPDWLNDFRVVDFRERIEAAQ